jgi:hypothetical protein
MWHGHLARGVTGGTPVLLRNRRTQGEPHAEPPSGFSATSDSPVSKTYKRNATEGRDYFALFQFIQQLRKTIFPALMAQPLLNPVTTKEGRR